jgi:hypothetical protein
MIISLRRLRQMLTFISLFVLLTLLISQLFYFITTLYPFDPPYQNKNGDAVKVSTHQTEYHYSAISNRLQLFYWTGE